MDAQLKRGILDVCILATIKDRETYGYEIIKSLKPIMELSESTLYTILKRLETADMIIVKSKEHEGRLRKYYYITNAGRTRIKTFLEEWKEIVTIYDFINKGE